MKRIIILAMPLLMYVPLFFVLTFMMSIGLDLAYPKYHNYYPFPTEVCNPHCNIFQLGLLGSVVYWISTYFVYIKLVQKNNYNPIYAAVVSLIIAVTTFIIVFAVYLYTFLFIPKTHIPVFLPTPAGSTTLQ